MTNQDHSDEAHQPKKFNFPKREFGKTKVIMSHLGLRSGVGYIIMRVKTVFFVILVLRLVSRRRFSGL